MATRSKPLAPGARVVARRKYGPNGPGTVVKVGHLPRQWYVKLDGSLVMGTYPSQGIRRVVGA